MMAHLDRANQNIATHFSIKKIQTKIKLTANCINSTIFFFRERWRKFPICLQFRKVENVSVKQNNSIQKIYQKYRKRIVSDCVEWLFSLNAIIINWPATLCTRLFICMSISMSWNRGHVQLSGRWQVDLVTAWWASGASGRPVPSRAASASRPAPAKWWLTRGVAATRARPSKRTSGADRHVTVPTSISTGEPAWSINNYRYFPNLLGRNCATFSSFLSIAAAHDIFFPPRSFAEKAISCSFVGRF